MSSVIWTREDDRSLAALLRAVTDRDLAGALLAVEGAPLELELGVRGQLRDWGARIAARKGEAGSLVGALTEVLVTELGFQGAGEEYHLPQNSYLSAVISRRSGLPILIASVWRLVGEVAGIPVEGVGMPFHFIARVGGEEGVLIDAFKGGRVLTEGDCAEMVATFSEGKLGWDPSFLAPCSVGDTVERVLRNLMNAFSLEGDLQGLYRSVRMISALRPDQPHYQLAQGRMAEFLGELNVATRVYTDLIQTFDGTEEAVAASARLVALAPGGLSN